MRVCRENYLNLFGDECRFAEEHALLADLLVADLEFEGRGGFGWVILCILGWTGGGCKDRATALGKGIWEKQKVGGNNRKDKDTYLIDIRLRSRRTRNNHLHEVRHLGHDINPIQPRLQWTL